MSLSCSFRILSSSYTQLHWRQHSHMAISSAKYSTSECCEHSSRHCPKRRHAMMKILVLFALSLLFLAQLPRRIVSQSQAAQAAGLENETNEFVQIADGDFVVGCKKFFVSGWNQWEVVEAAAGALELFGATLPEEKTGPQLVRGIMDKAVEHGLTVMRTWAHTVSAQYALQTAPGQYNEAVFQGLDYALDEARKRGLRVLLSLTDNWQATGGADEFVRWSGTARTHEDFFTDPTTKQLYKNHVQTVLNRVNTINGRAYRDDPTIFGWNLINEPRCYRCGNALQLWVNEMAAFVKSIDTRHLVTVGQEGFYPQGLPQSDANPQGATSWAFLEGQNFVADHSSPDIDFMAFHLWVDNWEDKTPEFARRWIQQHIADAESLGKPLLLEEFGKWGSGSQGPERDQYFKIIYDEIAESAMAGGPAKGAMFWQWYDEGQRAPAEEGGTVNGLFGIFDTDSTWDIIQDFTDIMNSLSGGQATGCLVRGRGMSPVTDPCRQTRVDGRPGTGFEGASCSQDINECARGTSSCHPNATCSNNPGGYTCTCPPTFVGDGSQCTLDEVAQNSMLARFSTEGPGRLACDEGQNVVFPTTAPGFAYDSTGALEQSADRQGGLGSRRLVNPVDCMLACELAGRCNSFSYNPEQKKCFLKAGASRQTCQAKETVCTSARGTAYSCGFWQTYYREEQQATGRSIPNAVLAERLAAAFEPNPPIISLLEEP